jgi:hypothetical protein
MEAQGWAVIDSATGLVVNVIVWDGNLETWQPPDGYEMALLTGYAGIGWSYADGVFTPPPVVPPTDAQIIAANTSTLQQANQLTTAQKTALTNRIDTLNDAIELKMATPEEVAELPVRTAQLLEWKRYAVFLGRVTGQTGWALTVVWPAQPAEGMDLTVSATAPETV